MQFEMTMIKILYYKCCVINIPVRHRLRELDDTFRLRVVDLLPCSLTEHNIHIERLWLRGLLTGTGSAITSSVSDSSVLKASEPTI